MTGRCHRLLAEAVIALLRMAAPPRLRRWVDDINGEVAAIECDRRALRFAVAISLGLLPSLLKAHLRGESPLVSIHKETAAMTSPGEGSFRPRVLAAVAATTAVVLGLVYLWVAGAPSHMLAINAVALAIGLVTLVIASKLKPPTAEATGLSMIAVAGLLLATALFGTPVDGAARWVRLGALFVQPSLILLPLLLMLFVRVPSGSGTVAMVVAAAALALQPDRAMAGMMVASLGVAWLLRQERAVLLALIVSLAAFCVTLVRPDQLPAVPFVDNVLVSSYELHPLTGLAVTSGALTLLLPAVAGWMCDPASRRIYAVFAAQWLAIVAAAAVGNYPTPLVGYGGSAILGYLLCLMSLPARTAAAGERGQAEEEASGAKPAGPLSLALPRARRHA